MARQAAKAVVRHAPSPNPLAKFNPGSAAPATSTWSVLAPFRTARKCGSQAMPERAARSKVEEPAAPFSDVEERKGIDDGTSRNVQSSTDHIAAAEQHHCGPDLDLPQSRAT